MSLRNTFFYAIKPVVPRSVQLALRRSMAKKKRGTCLDHWPINPQAGKQPIGWTGWPKGKKFAFVLMHDVDTEFGQKKAPLLLGLDRSYGFRSSFHFVPERYVVSAEIRNLVKKESCEVGVHGLKHDGKLFSSRKEFLRQAQSINRYLKEWECAGFSSPSMHRNLEWTLDFDILCETSTFDTDPFEPHPEGVGTIFPFVVHRNGGQPASWNSGDRQASLLRRSAPGSQVSSAKYSCYELPRLFVELPYTLAQDHCLFVILKEKSNRIWREKVDWIAEKGGMAFLNSHPDYMNFGGDVFDQEEYPVEYYAQFLSYVRERYTGLYWNALPTEVAQFWLQNMSHHRTAPQLSELKFDNSILRE